MEDFTIEIGGFDHKEGYDPYTRVFHLSADHDTRKRQREALRRMMDNMGKICFSDGEYNKHYWDVTYEEMMRRAEEHGNKLWKMEQEQQKKMSIEEYKQKFIELAKQLEKDYGTFQNVSIDAVFAASVNCILPIRYDVDIHF